MNAIASPFAKYKLGQPKQPERTEEPKQQSPFSHYRLEKSEGEESTLNNIIRQGARSASRIGEQIVGLPGDFRNLINMVIDPVVEPLLEQTFGKDISSERKKLQQETRILPTSRELRESSEESSKGFTKPKSTGERIADDYIETATNLLGPMKFRKALGLSALATSAKEGVNLTGLPEGAQEAAKFGTLLVGSMFNPKGVKNLWQNYYNEANKHIIPGFEVTAAPLLNKIDKIGTELSKGLEAPTESLVLKLIDKIKGKIQNGKITVEELVASKRSLNEIMQDPANLERGEKFIPKLNKAIDDGIKLYHNQDFIKNYRAGNEAYGAFYQSQKASRFIEKHLGNKPLLKAIFAAGAEALAGHPELVAPTLGGAGAIGLGVKGYELMHRIFNSKVMRKYYGDLFLSGVKKNARGTISSSEKLEKALNKS